MEDGEVGREVGRKLGLVTSYIFKRVRSLSDRDSSIFVGNLREREGERERQRGRGRGIGRKKGKEEA